MIGADYLYTLATGALAEPDATTATPEGVAVEAVPCSESAVLRLLRVYDSTRFLSRRLQRYRPAQAPGRDSQRTDVGG